MSDDAAYLADLVGVCDRFVAEVRLAIGDAAAERTAIERAVEHYRATRRAHGIFPDDEFVTHFFLADSLDDASGEVAVAVAHGDHQPRLVHAHRWRGERLVGAMLELHHGAVRLADCRRVLGRDLACRNLAE